jgi:DNA-binding response OmpR family regulator
MRRRNAMLWRAGAEALLTKPIDFVTLRNEIDAQVERAT